MCAGIVFLSHWHLWSNFLPQSELERAVRSFGHACHEAFSVLAWPTGGHHPAVIGFFVLSGFCIHYPFARRALAGGAPPDWPQYFGRRFWRIMPVYWAACALGLVFCLAQNLYPSDSLLLQLHASAPVADVVARFFGLTGLYPREVFAGNYILTTVAAEMLVYAAYPLFFRWAIQGHWRILGGLFLMAQLLVVQLMPWASPYWIFNSPCMFGIFWYGGALAARLYLTGRGQVRLWWLLAAWLGFLAVKMAPHFYGLNLLKQAACGLVCVLGVLWVVRWEERHAGLKDHPVAKFCCWTGGLSYSLYAMHTPAVMLASWSLLMLGITNYFAQLTTTMVASLAAVFAVHYWLERRLRPR